jgi:hypothetical protein
MLADDDSTAGAVDRSSTPQLDFIGVHLPLTSLVIS